MDDRNIAELFETMSLIAKKSMEEQDFSGTVIGKVVERISLSDSYLVNYQGVEILASSMGNAYSIGDEVIILVPNKDLNAQKFILGRTNSRTPTIGIGDDGSLSDLNIDYLQEIMEEVNNLLSDGKLTPKEKEQLAMNWDGIKADHEEVLSSSVDYPQVDLTSLKEYYKNLERLMNKVLSDMDNPTEEDLDELRKSMATYTIENRKVKNSVLEEIKKDISYSVSIISSNGESFKNGIISTQLRALVYKGKGEITSSLPNDSFSWKKLNERGEVISGWSHTGREVGVTEEDVDVKQIFRCSIEIEGATVAQDIVTLIDLSDGESLELTLESNMSRTQVYDKNSGKFTPDWSATNLVVDAKGTINGVDKTKDTRFTWFLNGQELLRADDRITISATGDKITFKKNILNSDDSVYLLTSEASYNNRDGIVLKNIKSIDLVLSINGENGTKGSDGKTSHTHFAWSNSEDGKLDFTLDPKEDMKYSGIYSSFSSVVSTEPSDYTWTRVLGTDGKGIESTTVLYQIGDSGTEMPNKKWTSEIPAPVKGKYLWTRTIILYTDKTVSMSHSVSYFPTDGQKGVDGNGILKTVVEYQIGNDGTNAPGGEWTLVMPAPVQGKYLWTKTTIHYTNKTSSIGYSTSYFAMDGEDGKDGTNGVPGKPGIDGKTSYIHYAWSDSSDGEIKFTTSYPKDGSTRAYVGTYSDYEEKDSTDPAKYEWARLLGEDGNGIESSTILYQIGDSGTIEPTGKWTAEIPSPIKGKYLWTRTITLYTNKEVIMSHSVSYLPTDGQNGTNGNGIKETAITYQIGDNGTSAPTGAWSTTTPTPIQGKYLWTKTVVTYTDKTSSISYSTSYFAKDGVKGKDGTNGVPGTPGKDGRTPYLHTAWANSSDGKKDFTTSYPSTGKRAYIGTYSDYEEEDNDDPAKYEWARILGEDGKDGTQGVPGKPGADGKTPYFHTAWANSSDGKEDFTPLYPRENLIYRQIIKDNDGRVSIDFSKYESKRIITMNKPASTTYSGAYFSVEDLGVKENRKYLFEYKYKKQSGLMTSFAGHTDATFSNNIVYTDDKLVNGSYTNSSVGWVADDTKEHKIQVIINTGSVVTPTDKIYIQPNRGGVPSTSQTLIVDIYDIMFTEIIDNSERGIINLPSPKDDPSRYPMRYIGTYSDYEEKDSTDPNKYTWAKFSGDNGISPLQISFNHPNGTVFRDTETKLTELSVDGIVYQGEKEVSSDLEVIKWFYRDTSIISSSPNYDIDGGPGWSYITDKNTIGGNLIDYSTSKLIVKEGAVDASSTFKMFVRYDGVATSGTTTLIDIEDPIQVIIEGNGLFKKGGTNKLEARVFIGRKELPEKEIDEKFEFSWRLSKVTSKARSASTGWPKTGRIIEVNEDEIPDGINNGIVCEIISK